MQRPFLPVRSNVNFKILCRSERKGTRGGKVTTNLQSSTELPVGIENVEIVASDEFLSESNNRHVQTDFSVMVCRVLSDVSSELSDLYRTVSDRFETPSEKENDEP